MTPRRYLSRTAAPALIAAYLLAASALAQRPTQSSNQSLHAAAAAGNLDRVQQLLQEGENIDLVDSPPRRDTPLITALEANQAEVANYLLDRGASVTVQNAELKTPLHYAAHWDQVELIKRIKTMHGALDALDGNSRLPLHNAVLRGSLEAVRLLLPRRGLLGQRDYLDYAPLDLALADTDDDKALLLLDAGAPFADDPIRADLRLDRSLQKNWPLVIDRMLGQLASQPGLRQPLLDRAYDFAFADGNTELLDRLAAAGANVSGPAANGYSRLFVAADLAHEHLVKPLLAAGADPNAAEPGSRWTPLHAAAMNPKLGVVQLLLDKGADLNAADGLHRTPLHLAAIAANPTIAAKLLNAGADPMRLDDLGNSALHYAAQANSEPTVRALIDAHAPQTPNAAGLTPFDLAGDEHPEVRGLLLFQASTAMLPLPDGFDALAQILASDASPEAVAASRERWTPIATQGTPLLHIAIQAASLTAIKQLLDEKPARINDRDSAGFLPTHLAAEITEAAILQELLARGAGVNDNQNSAQWTPLHFAAAAGNAEGLRLLLEKGADRAALDGLGHTPADVARQAGKPTSLAELQ